VVEPKARDREIDVKEDKTFYVEVGVTFSQGSGHDDQGQGVFEYLSFHLFLCDRGLIFLPRKKRKHITL
jgi:hypothetical protein